jgi:membrane dipeptidase
MTLSANRSQAAQFRTLALGALGVVSLAALTACAPLGIKSFSDPITTVDDVHRASFVLDAHADIVLPSTSKSYLGSDGRSKVAPEKLRQGGVDAVVLSVAVGPRPRTTEGRAEARALADEKLASVLAMAEASDSIVIAKSIADLTSAKESNQTALILGFQNAISLELAISNLDVFYQKGIRVFALNHIGHNAFSDSSRPIYDGDTGRYEPRQEHGGLSDLGVAAVKRINALGGVLDVSQMSKAATLQAVALSKTPVIASHSNVKVLSDVTRNLSDEEIDLIGQKGGVIHIAVFGAYLVDLSDPQLLEDIKAVRRGAGLPEAYAYPYELYWELESKADQKAFLGKMRATIGTGDVERLVDHIDYVASRIGVDHVGIGSDFNHGGGITGFQDATEAKNVTAALVRRGYSPEDVSKIWGGNFLRVLGLAENGS